MLFRSVHLHVGGHLFIQTTQSRKVHRNARLRLITELQGMDYMQSLHVSAFTFATIALIASMLWPKQAMAASSGSARVLCQAAGATGILTEPCKVSSWSQSVNITVDYGAAQAAYLCRGLADLARSHGLAFEPGWQIRVYSPFSEGNTTARCDL